MWPENFQTDERAVLPEKTEEWYRKTIELAQSNDIPLLIVADPLPGINAGLQAVYNTASDIAGEYGVPFLNFNTDPGAAGVDPATDFADGGHMNIWGAERFTRFLGAYLTEHYDLPDRRGNPAYQSWEDNAWYLEAVSRNGKLALGVGPEEAASLLQDPDYTCAVAVFGTGGTAYAPLLEALGVPAGETGAWLVSGGKVLWASGPEGEDYFPLDTHDLKLTASQSGTGMVFDREALETVPDGVSILVYDAVTQDLAAFLTFDAASG